MTRIGLMARAEDRGLGIQSWEFARNLDPSVLLVIPPQCPGFVPHLDRYPGATVATWPLVEADVKAWLRDVDVVYAAETFYETEFTHWCAEVGVETVVHVNPEFRPVAHASTQWWSPTTWRLERLPNGTEVVPVPVALDRFDPVAPHDGPCRWLHVAGHAALSDRNGTNAVLAALPHLQERCEVTIASQDSRELRIPALPPHVSVTVTGPVGDYWRLYDGYDALVLPRRYGGLCLPAQEAMAAGLAVAMSDVSPNPQTWPIVRLPVMAGRMESMPAGQIEAVTFDASLLAAAMDSLADPETRSGQQARSREWASGHSWPALAGLYRDRLACGVMV